MGEASACGCCCEQGQLDAIGRILNQVIRFTSDPKNAVEPNAGAGSLGRNTGEVLGVFAHIDVKHYETE